MYQYDTDGPAQGQTSPHTGILQKLKLKKGHNSDNNWHDGRTDSGDTICPPHPPASHPPPLPPALKMAGA